VLHDFVARRLLVAAGVNRHLFALELELHRGREEVRRAELVRRNADRLDATPPPLELRAVSTFARRQHHRCDDDEAENQAPHSDQQHTASWGVCDSGGRRTWASASGSSKSWWFAWTHASRVSPVASRSTFAVRDAPPLADSSTRVTLYVKRSECERISESS